MDKSVFIDKKINKDEYELYVFLEKYNFPKNLEKLIRKMKNKKIVIYGAGIFFQTIKKYYDLGALDVIGISDRKFSSHKQDETFLDYPVYGPEELQKVAPDYVLVATKFYVDLIENLQSTTLKGTRIKVKPLVKKSFLSILDEIW